MPGAKEIKNGAHVKGFESELEERMKAFFEHQRRFWTILSRSVPCSLIDFPVVMGNFPFVMTKLFFRSLLPFFPSSNRLAQYAQWFSSRKSRNGIARFLPPYRTVSAVSKLRAFDGMVIKPMKEKYPAETASMDFEKAEDILIETLTSWEKIPSLMENILTPFCWLVGISFVGLDPKTAIVLSRDRQIYHRWAELGRSWLGKTFLRIKWLFVDTVPWSYSAKFIAVGLLAYIVLMIIIESISVQIIYRKGIEKRLIEKISVTSGWSRNLHDQSGESV
jgi:hypothetical protein